MLDPKKLRENFDEINNNLNKRNFSIDKKKFISIDENRRSIISETEKLKNKKNIISKEIGELKSKNKDTELLEKEVEELRTDYITINNNYMFSRKETEILKRVKSLMLQSSKLPPEKITVKE